MKKNIYGTHTAPDIDAITALWLLKEYEDSGLLKKIAIFLKGGDESVEHFLSNLLLIDRGRGEFDHHQELANQHTSASLVAKRLGVQEDKYIQQLLGLVKRSDLQGISLPFDLSDIIKSLQRDTKLDDQQIVEFGFRLIDDVMYFQRNGLKRDNEFTQKVISQFLARKKRRPEKFIRYLEKLMNNRFERPFDFCEIIVAEETKNIQWEEFVEKILNFLYEDSANFYRALEFVERKAIKIRIRNHFIIAGVTNNPRFSAAARYFGASIIIQMNLDGHCQIYFNTDRVDWKLSDTLISMIRFEELMVRGRRIPKNIDFRVPRRMKKIPEWYYYLGAEIGNKKAGKFILNGSLTAPNVPKTKIPFKMFIFLAEKAVQYYKKFHWALWKAERIAFYTKNQREDLSPRLFLFKNKLIFKILKI